MGLDIGGLRVPDNAAGAERPVDYCRACAIPEWINPVDDHENWTGHAWKPGGKPDRRESD